MAGGPPIDKSVAAPLRRYLESSDRHPATENFGGDEDWRLVTDRYPRTDTQTPTCTLLQHNDRDKGWTTKLSLQPDGILRGFPVACRYTQPAGQVLAAGFNLIVYQTKDYDLTKAVTTAGGVTWKFTVPSLADGLYNIMASVAIVGLTPAVTTEDFILGIFKNGVEVSRGNRMGTASDASVSLLAADVLNLKAGDIITIQAFTLNNARTVEGNGPSNHVSIYRIPGS